MPISFRDWIRRSIADLSTKPFRGILHIFYTFYLGIWFTLPSRYPLGLNIYDENWDLLIVLDGCRTDVIREISDEYSFIDTIDIRWSIGSHSREWIANTFVESKLEEIQNTAIVSGNPHFDTVCQNRTFPPKETVPFEFSRWDTVDSSSFQSIDSLWQTHRSEGIGVPPRPITDRAIQRSRNQHVDYLIVHYMQPHIPYIADVVANGKSRELTPMEERGWDALRDGKTDLETVWSLYKDNLRLVLDEVELLLDNIDAERVVITSDHGNAFGEMGVYGHPEGFLHPVVRRVPWIETTATNKGTYIPTTESPDESLENSEHDAERVLEDLGYL